MRSSGYVKPIPETQALWQELKIAKANKDWPLVGKLSDKIRRATVEAKRK